MENIRVSMVIMSVIAPNSKSTQTFKFHIVMLVNLIKR